MARLTRARKKPRPRRTRREQLAPPRARTAGPTGSAWPGGRDRLTADDASPETLLQPEMLEGDLPAVEDRALPATDASLSVVDESAIGAGDGTDEAEDAQRKPISRAEHRRIRQRIARSGGSLANLDPNETQAGSPGRDRNR